MYRLSLLNMSGVNVSLTVIKHEAKECIELDY